MTGDAATSTGRRQISTVLSIAQKGIKVNIIELIDDLKSQIKQMEDVKTQITETQQELREAICRLQMIKEEQK